LELVGLEAGVERECFDLDDRSRHFMIGHPVAAPRDEGGLFELLDDTSRTAVITRATGQLVDRRRSRGQGGSGAVSVKPE
jgi:hypothetical protein